MTGTGARPVRHSKQPQDNQAQHPLSATHMRTIQAGTSPVEV